MKEEIKKFTHYTKQNNIKKFEVMFQRKCFHTAYLSQFSVLRNGGVWEASNSEHEQKTCVFLPILASDVGSECEKSPTSIKLSELMFIKKNS